jgi:hypothetical protein
MTDTMGTKPPVPPEAWAALVFGCVLWAMYLVFSTMR